MLELLVAMDSSVLLLAHRAERQLVELDSESTEVGKRRRTYTEVGSRALRLRLQTVVLGPHEGPLSGIAPLALKMLQDTGNREDSYNS